MSVWLSSNEEKRSFDFFLNRAGTRLGGFFNVPFWSREVLQAAINYPSIRHLVVALGATYEQYENNSYDHHQSRFSLQECNRSISHITKLAGSSFQSAENMYCIITASILFATYASLQGHIAQSINHIRSGIKVLRSLDSRGINSDFPIPLSRLRLYLTNLYAQVRTMINDEALTEWQGQDPLASTLEPIACFVSLSEAHDYVEALYNNTLAFLQMTGVSQSVLSKQKEENAALHHMLTCALRSSCNALNAFVERSVNRGDDKAIALLRLHQTLLSIRLGLSVLGEDKRESLFDELEQQLVQMLSYCRLFLRSDDNTRSGEIQQPVSSSGLGVIMPLHTVAARCRNPAVRQEAVELLRQAKRREGLWDSALVERIVSTTIELEEKGSPGTTSKPDRDSLKVPDNDRVREVKINFEGDRSARVVFVTVKQWREKKSGHQRFIEW
jgi:hypothetical protein